MTCLRRSRKCSSRSSFGIFDCKPRQAAGVQRRATGSATKGSFRSCRSRPAWRSRFRPCPSAGGAPNGAHALPRWRSRNPPSTTSLLVVHLDHAVRLGVGLRGSAAFGAPGATPDLLRVSRCMARELALGRLARAGAGLRFATRASASDQMVGRVLSRGCARPTASHPLLLRTTRSSAAGDDDANLNAPAGRRNRGARADVRN